MAKSSKRGQDPASFSEPCALPKPPIPSTPHGKCEWCPRYFLDQADQDEHIKECKKATRRCHFCSIVVAGAQSTFELHLKSQHKWVFCDSCSCNHIEGKHTTIQTPKSAKIFRKEAFSSKEPVLKAKQKLKQPKKTKAKSKLDTEQHQLSKELAIEMERLTVPSCQVCKKVFVGLSQLNRHMAEEHVKSESEEEPMHTKARDKASQRAKQPLVAQQKQVTNTNNEANEIITDREESADSMELVPNLSDDPLQIDEVGAPSLPKCPYCPSAGGENVFSDNHQLLDHLQSYHPRCIRVCHICIHKFHNQSMFLRHMTVTHNMSIEDLDYREFCEKPSKTVKYCQKKNRRSKARKANDDVITLSSDCTTFNAEDIIDEKVRHMPPVASNSLVPLENKPEPVEEDPIPVPEEEDPLRIKAESLEDSSTSAPEDCLSLESAEENEDPVTVMEASVPQFEDRATQTEGNEQASAEMRKHSKVTYYCPFCPVWFMLQVQLINHIYKEHPAPLNDTIKEEPEDD